MIWVFRSAVDISLILFLLRAHQKIQFVVRGPATSIMLAYEFKSESQKPLPNKLEISSCKLISICWKYVDVKILHVVKFRRRKNRIFCSITVIQRGFHYSSSFLAWSLLSDHFQCFCTLRPLLIHWIEESGGSYGSSNAMCEFSPLKIKYLLCECI